MKDSYKYLIAKNDNTECRWLPLWVHSLDTYFVMQYLLSHWLSDGMFFSLVSRTSPENIKRAALFLALFHDYGKSSITFQAKISEGAEELHRMQDRAALNTPLLNDPELRNGREMPHGIAGEIMLLIRKCPDSLAAIVGSHHGRPWEKGPETALEIEEIFEDDEDEIYRNFSYSLRLWGGRKRREGWIKAQDSLFDWALGIEEINDIRELPAVDDKEGVILSGLVVMADWLASNEEYFPLIPYNQLLPGNMDERAERAIEKIKLPPTWRPSDNKDFKNLSMQRFGFFPNEIQTVAAEAVLTSTDPGLLILEAPMGIGKTEAALLAAEEFSDARVKGIMFALPTQATANGIFTRILDWGRGQTVDNAISIRLAHGMASLNDDYRALIDSGRHSECTVDDYEENRLIVHEFFQGAKQALLADFVVGTVDQILLAALKQKHFMLRHLGLCGKVVIIDECHAYDAYMNEYMERALQWLGAYNTPVIMLSATLPYERRAAFVDAYLGGNIHNKNDSWRRSLGYPLLTWTDGKEVYQKEIEYAGIKREVKIEKLPSPDGMEEQIVQVRTILYDNLKSGGCAAVIANTVRRAQLLALAMKAEFPEKHILLLHSRFISEDRIEYEKELLLHAGKKSSQSDRDGLIVIGTQVIEQSLDFDVDLMITDLCPIDLLLQRIGRLHRHPSHDEIRPDLLKKPKCYVLGTGNRHDNGSEKVYGKYLLMRTDYFLPDQISLPADISHLVQRVYDDNCLIDQEPEGYSEAKAEHQSRQVKLRKDADAFRLLPPGKERTINRFLEASVLIDEEQAKAQVRNGAESAEVIVLFSMKYGITRAPWRYRDSYDLNTCPAADICREISKQTVKLPAWAAVCDIENEFCMPAEWEKSVWLKGKRLLILDEFGKAEKGDLIIHYSHESGLLIERRS